MWLCLLLLCLSPGAASGQGTDTYGRLTGKRAVAVFDESTPGQLNGRLEFSLCDTSGVFVQVALEDSVTGYSCLDNPLLERCLYQINDGSVALGAEGSPSGDLEACGDPLEIFDPTGSGGYGWPPLDEEEDICSSTKSATFGEGGKLESCPVGGLSRKWGVLDPFFDQNLAIFNNIIGRSLLVYSISPEGQPKLISCAPIVFASNCHDAEKEALLAFKDSLDSGTELLESWQQEKDMCDEFVGIRCDPQGHVVQLLLDSQNLQEVRAGLAPSVSSLAAQNSSANGTLSPVPPPPSQRGAVKLAGPLPPDFGTLSYLKVMKLPHHNLYGAMPTRWSRLLDIREMNLTNNRVNGRLPKSFAAMLQLQKLDLSSNELTGTVPTEWSALIQLQRLNLSSNNLTGTVPLEWKALTGINDIILSGNAGLCDPSGMLQSTANVTVATDLCGAANPEPPPTVGGGEDTDSGDPGAGSGVVILVSVLVPVIVLCITLIGFLVWGYKYHHSTRLSGVLKSASRMTRDDPRPDPGPTSSTSREEADAGAESLKSGGKGSAELKIEMGGLDDTALSNPKGVSRLQVHSPFVDSPYSTSPTSLRSDAKEAGSQPGDGHRAVVAAAMRCTSDSTKSPVGSVSDSTGGLVHCPSGMHPLDFSGVQDVPGAVVFKNQLLGGGGYGVVYRGTLLRGTKVLDVAVKVISNSDQDELHSSKYKSFVDEVETLSLVQGNDCIVTMYEYVLDYPRAIIFYEFLENDTLGRLIHKARRKLNYLEVLQMGYGISEGLVGLHTKGIIHRDLKPDNILLDTHMRPRLTDFGISRKMNPDASSITTQNIGTWIYMVRRRCPRLPGVIERCAFLKSASSQGARPACTPRQKIKRPPTSSYSLCFFLTLMFLSVMTLPLLLPEAESL